MRNLLLSILTFMSVAVCAQTADTTLVKPAVEGQASSQQKGLYLFGYFSYKTAIESMPEYATAKKQMDELADKYEAEAKRAESEFNQKYEDFLAGQADFPQSIREKRQNELMELMSKNVAFRNESRRLLTAAEGEALAPLHDKLSKMLRLIGEKEGFAFILNTDDNACPYVNAARGKDINQLLKDCLQQ